MLIYFLLFIVWVLGYFFCKDSTLDEKVGNIRLALFCFVTLSLVMGLRHYSVGTDTEGYVFRRFLVAPGQISEGVLAEKEYGFTIYLIILGKMGCSPQLFIFITSTIIAACFSYSFYRNCGNLLLAFFLHVTFGMFAMTMSGMRQALAMGVFLLVFELLKTKRIIWALLLIYIASTFHQSVLITLPIVIMPYISFKKKKLYLILLGIIVFFTISSSLLEPIMEVLASDDYIKDYGTIRAEYQINIFLTLIQLGVSLIALRFRDQLRRVSVSLQNIDFLIVMSLVNSFFYLLAINNNMIARLGFYFATFNVIILANVLSSMESKVKPLLYIIVTALTLAFFIKATVGGTLHLDNYRFFWQ